MKQPSVNRPANLNPGDLAVPGSFTDPVLLRALEAAPHLQIPADFATRVASLAVTQALRPESRWKGALVHLRPENRSVAAWVTMASGILLLAALFAFAPGTSPNFLDLRFDVELLLLAELGGICYVLARLSAD